MSTGAGTLGAASTIAEMIVAPFTAGALIAGIRYIPSDQIIPQDGASVMPDNQHTVYPIPRDPKIDVIETLRAVISQIGTDIPISKDGTFTANQLGSPTGKSNPYIVVTRTGDRENRVAIGKHFGVFSNGDVRLVDDSQLVIDHTVIRGSFSVVTLNVDIYDLISTRADQVYTITKIILEAASEVFNQLGYTNFVRTNGTDAPSLKIEESGFIVFNRTLTYTAWYPVFVATMDTLATIVSQMLTFDDANGNATSATETTII